MGNRSRFQTGKRKELTGWILSIQPGKAPGATEVYFSNGETHGRLGQVVNLEVEGVYKWIPGGLKMAK